MICSLLKIQSKCSNFKQNFESLRESIEFEQFELLPLTPQPVHHTWPMNSSKSNSLISENFMKEKAV